MEFKEPKIIDDLKGLKQYNWDVTLGKEYKPMLVGRLPGFMHTKGGKYGENCLYCWPRGEAPTIENITPYDGDGGANWGLEYKECQSYHNHMGDTCIDTNHCTVITRNGKDFYTVNGKLEYSMPKAITILHKIAACPIDFNAIDYEHEELLGKKILYKNYPGVITLWCKGQGCIIVEYDGDPKYKEDALRLWNDGLDDEDFIKLDIIGYDHYDIDWFPDSSETKTYNCKGMVIKNEF